MCRERRRDGQRMSGAGLSRGMLCKLHKERAVENRCVHLLVLLSWVVSLWHGGCRRLREEIKCVFWRGRRSER